MPLALKMALSVPGSMVLVLLFCGINESRDSPMEALGLLALAITIAVFYGAMWRYA